MAIEVYLNKELIDKLLPEALIKGLEKSGQLIENEAKRKVAVDDGILRSSITHEVDEENFSVTIGTNVEYAPYVEFPTGIHAQDGRQTPWTYQDAKGEWHTTEGTEAQPFLQPAVDENINNIVKQFENLLGE